MKIRVELNKKESDLMLKLSKDSINVSRDEKIPDKHFKMPVIENIQAYGKLNTTLTRDENYIIDIDLETEFIEDVANLYGKLYVGIVSILKNLAPMFISLKTKWAPQFGTYSNKIKYLYEVHIYQNNKFKAIKFRTSEQMYDFIHTHDLIEGDDSIILLNVTDLISNRSIMTDILDGKL